MFARGHPLTRGPLTHSSTPSPAAIARTPRVMLVGNRIALEGLVQEQINRALVAEWLKAVRAKRTCGLAGECSVAVWQSWPSLAE